MTKNELMEFINSEGIDLSRSGIVLGSKSNTPYTMGCYEENGLWYIYEVGERQDFGIINSGNEEEIMKHFYYKILGRISEPY